MSVFEAAWAFTSKWEGGYSNHPNDPGGSTMFGITQATYNSWAAQHGIDAGHVKDISRNTVLAIAKQNYWDAMGLDVVADSDPALAIALFDWGFHSGTRNVLNRTEGMTSATEVMDARVQFLTELTNFNSFGRGWIRRVEDLRQFLKEFTITSPDVEMIQVFDGEHLLATFHPRRVSLGTTESGRTKIMVKFR